MERKDDFNIFWLSQMPRFFQGKVGASTAVAIANDNWDPAFRNLPPIVLVVWNTRQSFPANAFANAPRQMLSLAARSVSVGFLMGDGRTRKLLAPTVGRTAHGLQVQSPLSIPVTAIRKMVRISGTASLPT